jgi:hypothetical protein
MIAWCNRIFDCLPRSEIRVAAREMPAFRLIGTVGFYSTCVMVTAAALVTRKSLAITAALMALAAVTFYVYAGLRRWIAGRESLVLLEHVWFTLACCAGLLLALRQPVAAYLDMLAPPLALFLAFGRMGCLVAGCCHGHPASVGIVYGGDTPFAGIRLFPVQAIEAAGLLAISFSGFAMLPFAAPGNVLAWYLVAYAVMRFGLEHLRGDRRPYWLGLSQAQWMSLAEVLFAVFVVDGRPVLVGAAAVLVFAVALWRWFRSPRRRLLRRPHLGELRSHIDALVDAVLGTASIHPALHKTSEGAAIAVSWAGASLPGAAHVSLSYRGADGDLLLLAELAAAAFPALLRNTARVTPGRVLHFMVPTPLAEPERAPGDREKFARQIYVQLFRHKSQEEPVRVEALRSTWFFDTGKGG